MLYSKVNFSLLAALLATQPVLAQSADSARSSTYRHQLGLTASPVLVGFFKNNRSLPVGLLYKRQVKPNQAWRLRIVGQYSHTDSTNFMGYLPGTSTRHWAVAGFVGYEWQRPLRGRLVGYYGVELGTSWSRETVREVRRWQNEYGLYYHDGLWTHQRWQLQGRGFAGLNWQVTKYLSVFTETAFLSTYQRRFDDLVYSGFQEYTDRPGDETPAGGSARYDSKEFTLQWRPVQFIGVSTQF